MQRFNEFANFMKQEGVRNSLDSLYQTGPESIQLDFVLKLSYKLNFPNCIYMSTRITILS